MYRTGQLLSIKGEKVSEVALYSALTATVERFSQKMEGGLTDFSSCESVFLEYLNLEEGEFFSRNNSDVPNSLLRQRFRNFTGNAESPYYVIFVELPVKQEVNKLELEKEFAKEVENIREVNINEAVR
jgi:hypothetical protein